jgi:lipopolysaccharide biosynthesis regulator YciM
LYASGCRHLEAANCESAIDDLSRAVAARADERRYVLKLAEAYLCAGRLDAARRLLENVRPAHVDDVELAVALARVYLAPPVQPNAARGVRDDARRAADILSPLESRLDAEGLLLLIQALDRAEQPSRAAVVARDGLERFPRSETLWLARIDQALAQQRAALALKTVDEARQTIADSGALAFRAAHARLLLGQALGSAQVRTVAGGRVGHVHDGWLLIEARRDADSFLCCPRDSALFEIRRAIDAGLDSPELHCLHARAWQKAAMPQRGFQLLKERAVTLLEQPDAATLHTYLDVALAAGELEAAASYALRAAQLQPERRAEILYDAYGRIAEAYSQRGDELMYVEFLRRAIDQRPEDVGLALRLAEAEWSADRRSAATRIYERLLREHPELAGDQRILERLAETQPAPPRP